MGMGHAPPLFGFVYLPALPLVLMADGGIFLLLGFQDKLCDGKYVHPKVARTLRRCYFIYTCKTLTGVGLAYTREVM